MFIDTHLHLVDRARLHYPWLAGVPALDRDWPFADYARMAARLGIEGCLHMEVDVAPEDIGAETLFVRDQMGSGLMRGAISSARPESADFPGFLDRLDRKVVRGIRRVLHVVPDEVSQSVTFRENVARMGTAGLPFDICVLARQLPLAADLADACADTVLVLDHCGVPDIAGGGYDGWAAAITDLARRENVHAKISGITAYAAPDWTLDTLRPYVEHIVDRFGWNRVVWGSDSPVCTLNASLETWVAATHALMAGCSDSERAALYRDNARRLWAL
ncbi:amidohydrolase family protein [Salipiger sp.]|uniref:amidohydrolase family protein n=1 Tax=Salipiger sp. TaxID=2078585 RepID=UPI003A97EEF6